ncbi:hypothetical protein ACOMHN_058307 [Nucella lapillus]
MCSILLSKKTPNYRIFIIKPVLVMSFEDVYCLFGGSVDFVSEFGQFSSVCPLVKSTGSRHFDSSFCIAAVNFQASSLVWPTASGISEAAVRATCQRAVTSSQLWAGCQSFPHLSDLTIDDYVLDISDSYNFLEAAVSAFQAECQMTLAENPANYVTDSEGKNVLKPQISSDVCSVFCLRHGRCVRGKCVCFPGYTGDNCDLLAGKGLQLLQIRGNGTCDVNERPCRKIFIDTLLCGVTTHLAARMKTARKDDKNRKEENVTKAAGMKRSRQDENKREEEQKRNTEGEKQEKMSTEDMWSNKEMP